MRDTLMTCVWCGVNIELGVEAWRVARRFFPRDSAPQLLVHTIVISMSLIVALGTMLGALGLLFPIAYLGLVGLAAAILGRVSLFHREDHAEVTKRPGPGWGWSMAWGVWGVFTVGLVFTSGLDFPTDWDALMYHLPLVNHWLQARSLYAPECYYWFYPANAELFSLWIVGPFSGDFLIGLTDLPALILFAVAAVELGMILGLRRSLAHVIGLIVVTHPVSAIQLLGIGNDVPAAAFFLAGLWYGFRLVDEPDRPTLWLLAASLGLLAGVKYYALGYAGFGGFVICVLVLVRRGVRPTLGVAFTLAAGFLLLAGYWYLRNFFVAGSPLYPKGLTEETDVILKKYPDLAHSSLWGNQDPRVLGLVSAAVYRMIGPTAWIAFVATPISLVWLFVTGLRGSSRERGTRLALGVLLAGSAVLIASTPYAAEDDPGTLNALMWGYHPSRYGLCYLSLAVIALAMVIQDLCEGIGRAVTGPHPKVDVSWLVHAPLIVFGILGILQLRHVVGGVVELTDVLSLEWIVVAASAMLAMFLVSKLNLRARRYALALALPLVIVAAGWSVGVLSDHWHGGYVRHYGTMFGTETFSVLEQADPASIRLCVHDYRGYPFFGSRRQIRVCQPYYAPGSGWLMDYLRANHATHIAVRKAPSEIAAKVGLYFWWFDQCLAGYPDRFAKLCEGDVFTFFAIRKASWER